MYKYKGTNVESSEGTTNTSETTSGDETTATMSSGPSAMTPSSLGGRCCGTSESVYDEYRLAEPVKTGRSVDKKNMIFKGK